MFGGGGGTDWFEDDVKREFEVAGEGSESVRHMQIFNDLLVRYDILVQSLQRINTTKKVQ